MPGPNWSRSRVLELLHLRERRRAGAQERTLRFRNDSHAEFAADAADGLAAFPRIGGLERGAHRLQLHDLGVAERAHEKRRAIVPEDARIVAASASATTTNRSSARRPNRERG